MNTSNFAGSWRYQVHSFRGALLNQGVIGDDLIRADINTKGICKSTIWAENSDPETFHTDECLVKS